MTDIFESELMSNTYLEHLQQAVNHSGTVLCIGLDPEPSRLPRQIKESYSSIPDQVEEFCRQLIDATQNLCCAYKPNLAFFEALGSDGMLIYKKIVQHIRKTQLHIADAKRGDIGNTAGKYAHAFFDEFKADALTLNPFMGFETLEPFLQREEKGIYVLTLTSNPGSADFMQAPFMGYASLAAYTAKRLYHLDQTHVGHVGMVVGATKADKLHHVISEHSGASLLLPGVGAQAADVNSLSDALLEHPGIPVIPVSRGILFGDDYEEDWLNALIQRVHGFRTTLDKISRKYVNG